MTPRPRLRPRLPAGFSLIELLVVVVVLGLLAAIAIPKFTGSKARAVQAAAKSDLRNLTLSQESYRENHGAYAPDLATLGVLASSGVVLTIVESSPTGWSANATSPGSSCSVFTGSAGAVVPASAPSVIACE